MQTERETKQYEDTQSRQADLLESNATLPCTINQVRVIGAHHTRPYFLSRALSHLLEQDKHYTLTELVRDVNIGSERLHRFGIFHEPISMFIDKPDQIDGETTPTDVNVFLSVTEKNRILFQSGTEVGNAEGNAYANAQFGNIFGGAEALNLNATFGTRTKSSYQVTAQTPILANPNLWLEAGGLTSSTQKPWASHDEAQRGGWTLLRYLTNSGHRHELKYGWNWRTISGLTMSASPSVRYEAGHNVKSSISHTWTHDTRDNPALPTGGVLAKTVNEIAGLGPLGGDVAFWKSEVDTQAAAAVPLLGQHGWTFTAGLRAGLLCPLPLGSDGKTHASRLSDRFILGGPSDIRGFRIAGLGPRDGEDAVGGDVYAAGSANVLFPLPRVGKDRPFRGQAFVTAGRLSALSAPNYDADRGFQKGDVQNGLYDTVRRMGSELPSTAVGLGLVYAHPVARFEVNFSLPLVARQGEQPRKGLSVGIGISML